MFMTYSRPVHFLRCLSRVEFEVRKSLLVFSYLFSCFLQELSTSCLSLKKTSETRKVTSFVCVCFSFDECSVAVVLSTDASGCFQ